MSEDEFMYYPELEDETFYEDIYKKKEFRRTKISPDEYYAQSMEEICGSGERVVLPEKILQPHQEFLRNYVSNETPYNGIMLFHGVGTGKCLLPNSEVYINGTLEKLEDIWNKYKSLDLSFDGEGEWSIPIIDLNINSYDEHDGKIKECTVNRLYRQEVSEKIVVLELDNGRTIKLTKSHHLLTETGWSTDFINNQYVKAPRILINQGNTFLSNEVFGTKYSKAKSGIREERYNFSSRFERQASDIDTSSDLRFVKINKVWEEEYSGFVYDLEIEKQHNYVADGIICHNTCAAISIAEGLKPRLQALGKKVYIIAPSQTQPNFENEIYSMSMEDKEREAGIEPGSYQCTGQTYYIPPKSGLNEEKRQRQIKRAAYGKKSIYEFFGQGTSFPSYVEFQLRKPQDTFSNSVIIVDEAHNLVSDAVTDIEDKPIKGKKITKRTEGDRGPAPVKKTIETLRDLFSGYYSFKTEWVQNNPQLKQELTQIRSQLEATKTKSRTRTNITKILQKETEIRATQAWKSLSSAERKQWQKKAPKNVKVILMTASPMENSPKELIELLNLLRLNDKRSLIDTNKMFHDLDDPRIPLEDKVDKTYLCKMAKGYISYVRGQNPITFPAVLDPPEDILYDPGYLNPADPNDTVPLPLFSIDGKSVLEGTHVPLRLVYSPMSIIQYQTHFDWVDKEMTAREFAQAKQVTKMVRGSLQLGREGRQISNIVFPTVNPNRASFGNPGFENVFSAIKREKIPIGTTKTGAPISRPPSLQFRYDKDRKLEKAGQGLNGLRAFIKQEDLVDSPGFGLLHEYSPKFQRIIDNMQDPDKWGINFSYSEFKFAGAISLGIVLELNGYVKYTHSVNFSASPRTGKYSVGTYDSLVNEDIYQRYPELKRRYRCYKCAKLDVDPIHDMAGDDPLKHPFKQGTFILFIGGSEAQRRIENEIVKQRENRYGEIIKVILGSKVSGEGVNFMNVRQVHILDPWHHNTRLYQAMGRAIRHCSHRDLPPGQRNVTVYKYSATVPELFDDQRSMLKEMYKEQPNMNLNQVARPNVPELSFISLRDLMTETTDEMVYFRVLRKDILIKYVERILKEIAIDCAFFKAINVFPKDLFPAEVDGSRLCDYLPCNYPCIWNCGPPQEYWDPNVEYDINTDTYNLFFSKVQVDRVIRYIQRIFQNNWALTLDDIVKLVKEKDPRIEVEYIYQALDKMLQQTPDRPIIVDRYKREGYLIFRGNYYLVQPNELSRKDIPVFYRQMALKVKPKARNIERLKPAEVVIIKKEILDTGKLDNLLNNLMGQNEIITIESEMDRLTRPELQYLYEKIKLNNSESPLTNILENYLGKRRLLLETEDGYIGHFIKDARMYIPAKNGAPGEFVNAPKVRVNAADRFLEEQEGSALRNIGPEILFDPNDPFDLQFRFYGYYDDSDDKFKLVDLSAEVTKLTKEKTISRKSHVKGRNCADFRRPQLVSIAKALSEIPDPNLLNSNERTILKNTKGTKGDFCTRIEAALRILNERDPERRWFLYPGEQRCIDHDQEGRHIINRDPSHKELRTCIKDNKKTK